MVTHRIETQQPPQNWAYFRVCFSALFPAAISFQTEGSCSNVRCESGLDFGSTESGEISSRNSNVRARVLHVGVRVFPLRPPNAAMVRLRPPSLTCVIISSDQMPHSVLPGSKQFSSALVARQQQNLDLLLFWWGQWKPANEWKLLAESNRARRWNSVTLNGPQKYRTSSRMWRLQLSSCCCFFPLAITTNGSRPPLVFALLHFHIRILFVSA